MVEYLISHGANPNANVGLANSRALEHATPYAPMSIIRILCDAGAKLKGRRALSNAAANGRTDVVAYLLEGGAVIDEVPENDDISDNARELGVKNALCEAAYIGQSEVVKMLLERGANVDVKDTKGKSALKLAEEGGHEACVRILKEHTGS
jgi:ankyrin repeat protein